MILPAVDVAAGRAAQVPAGEPNDVMDVARRWVDAGAEMMHVVDLDAAHRRGENADLVRLLVANVDVPVQLSGGIDTYRRAEAALATGASRINLASSALLDLEMVRALIGDYGPRVVVGIDVRACGGGDGHIRDHACDQVVARGSDVAVGAVDDVIASLTGLGVSTVLVADASRDGARTGVDLALFTRMVDRLHRHLGRVDVVASGGVATLADLSALATLAPVGVRGVVLGAALHHGTFTLSQAQAVLAASSAT